jgi:hypothetical protein
MISAADCYKKYGEPSKTNPFLTWWDVPTKYEINQIPKKLWCNKDLVKPLEQAFENLLTRGFIPELCTWDGCFNIRVIRGYEKKHEALTKTGRAKEAAALMSIHSWAIGIDVNAFENQLGQVPKLSAGFVKCFTDAGFDWGGKFNRVDGMHFQLAQI